MVNMKRVVVILFILFIPIESCETQSNRIEINNTIESDKKIETYIVPYKNNVDAQMDDVLSYSPIDYDKKNGVLNTAIGNMMADVTLKLSNPIYNTRTGNNIDFVLLNHGGIRSIISKGDITLRSAYNIMPFENSVVVCQLKGSDLKELINYLILNKKAHPISGIITNMIYQSYFLPTLTLKHRILYT